MDIIKHLQILINKALKSDEVFNIYVNKFHIAYVFVDAIRFFDSCKGLKIKDVSVDGLAKSYILIKDVKTMYETLSAKDDKVRNFTMLSHIYHRKICINYNIDNDTIFAKLTKKIRRAKKREGKMF